ncbi:hypothetical protein NADFUDRAFT_45861 [Nadsonia fulvescens var. elongata DSM 6958]|uniref:Nucleoporin Nup54 alpha-helical domain-containing protein n=1 Tax=Nadsonia fulvescens var. elongata DSM 6958 TaxID=857566 RepID=A0A1E3PLS4_9ASCO|nr:hypothetical protein NADFUDRAFT_45861 [Nadsonia fulvescens var. elongata DSM 6958]
MQRTLSLATKLQVLRNRGYVLKPEEEILNQKLKELNQQMDDPKVFGRINEIWARMSVLRERANGINKQMADLGYVTTLLDWERDSEKLEKMAKILKAQQTGIAYLASVLKRDTEEIEKLINSFHGVE